MEKFIAIILTLMFLGLTSCSNADTQTHANVTANGNNGSNQQSTTSGNNR